MKNENKKESLKDYELLYKAYLDLRQELSIIKRDNYDGKQLKKLIN